ncbi:tryptophan permease [Lewinellaceae bacterium SD302]|nr:tryptophan permease [Lewinellaceae bacterium SD302]
MAKIENRSILIGVMITAGTAIGAGMFSLPIVSSGMWFVFSLIALFYLWVLNYLSALYILETNVHFEPGDSFNAMSISLLGKNWNFLLGIMIGFLMYILLYAYFSAFGHMSFQTSTDEVATGQHWGQGLTGLFLGALFALLVWSSTSTVGKVSTVLVIGMVISFIVAMVGYTLTINPTNLFDTGGYGESYLSYVWAALPYFVTSFGFAAVVPSLYKYYGKRPLKVRKSIFWGAALVFLVYVLFIVVTFGNIGRDEFTAINAAGGSVGHLVDAFNDKGVNHTVNFALKLFSNFAIITSFLGVGLGLFDYIADRFAFKDDVVGRLKSACLTFLPPGLASFFFPHGFIYAIGVAGLVAILAFYVAPYFMVLKVRKTRAIGSYQVKGGKGLLWFFILSSLLVAVCQLLSMLNYLPKW